MLYLPSQTQSTRNSAWFVYAPVTLCRIRQTHEKRMSIFLHPLISVEMRFMSLLSFGWTFIVRWCPSKRPENFVHAQQKISPETDSEIRPLSDGCAFCPVCVLYLVVFHTFPSARRPAGSVAAGYGTDGTGMYSTSNAYTPHSHRTPAGCLQDDYRSKRM